MYFVALFTGYGIVGLIVFILDIIALVSVLAAEGRTATNCSGRF